MNSYRHIFLDMDGTVTRSRSVLSADMREQLMRLMASGRDVMIVSGQGVDAMKRQVGIGTYYMGQNGNHVESVSDSRELWKETLTDDERSIIFEHIALLPKEKVRDENDLIDDRGSQITYSILGHHEDVSLKETYDVGGAKRRALLEKYPFHSETLEVKIAGTTSLDYIRRAHNKGTNILRLITTLGWNKDECLYIGDSLFPGGNDEAVIGVIDTKAVTNPTDALRLLDKILE